MKKLLFVLFLWGCSEEVVQPKGCFVGDQNGVEVFIRCLTYEEFQTVKNSKSYEFIENKRFETTCSECQ